MQIIIIFCCGNVMNFCSDNTMCKKPQIVTRHNMVVKGTVMLFSSDWSKIYSFFMCEVWQGSDRIIVVLKIITNICD